MKLETYKKAHGIVTKIASLEEEKKQMDEIADSPFTKSVSFELSNGKFARYSGDAMILLNLARIDLQDRLTKLRAEFDALVDTPGSTEEWGN